MDLRTNETTDRKLSEARQKRDEAKEKKRQAETTKDAARAKQREIESYNKKAEEATKHVDKLKQERERCLDRIRGEPMINLNNQRQTQCLRLLQTHRRMLSGDE